MGQHLHYDPGCYNSQPVSNGFYQQYREYYYDQHCPGNFGGNNVYTCQQPQENVLQPVSSFAPRLNSLNNVGKYCAPSTYFNVSPYDEIYMSNMYPKPVVCQEPNQSQFYLPKTRSNSNFMKSDPSIYKGTNYTVKNIPTLKSVGILNRKSQMSSSSNWTPRIVQNNLENIPVGARPILRRSD